MSWEQKIGAPIQQIQESESFAERFEGRAEQIVSRVIAENLGVNCSFVEIRKTSKSVFGVCEIEGKRIFFKIAPAEKIAQELQGYRLADEYPHEKLIVHSFEEDYGVYLQEYCQEINGTDGQMYNQINSSLYDNDDFLLERTDSLFELIGGIYGRTLTPEPLQMNGKNDDFFHDRARLGGRLDQFYSGKTFAFPSIGEAVSFEELKDFRISINGAAGNQTISQLISQAQEDLNPVNKRYFVISQGDSTETNMTLSKKFFDFETGGYNSLVQDIAIFCYYNYTGGHYFIPKYSKNEPLSEIKINNPNTFRNLRRFADEIEIEFEIERESRLFSVRMKFPYPELKKRIAKQYIENVVRPAESNIGTNEIQNIIRQLQSAFLLRIVGVKNLTKLEDRDIAMSLAMIQHFCSSSSEEHFGKISDFLDKKLSSIQ